MPHDLGKRIRLFRLDDNFQATFDKWAVDIEQSENGQLAMTHETVHNDTLLVFYRLDPTPLTRSVGP